MRYYANITNIAVSCGMLYGAARRKDGSASLFFDPGTEWTIPMYSCASASKASIKTVSFRYNGTRGLQSLEVTDIRPKEYEKEEDLPLWAVENLKMRLGDVNPIWGFTTAEHSKHPNISTARQSHLYLPGLSNGWVTSPTSGTQNLAGVDFYSKIMALTYDMAELSDDLFYALPDYSGRANLAMYNKWQELSREPGKAATIINLIWTDISANAVLGSKGHLSSAPLQGLSKRDEPATTAKVPVTVYTRRTRFKWRYSVPAFLTLLLGAAISCLALVFVCIGRATPSRIRHYLDQTSAGRIFTTFLYPMENPSGLSRTKWLRLVGHKGVHVGTQFPRATSVISNTAGHSVVPLTALKSPSRARAVASGKLYEGSISMHNLPSPQPYSPMNVGGEAMSYYAQTGNAASTHGADFLNPTVAK
jgi:hypothetical protein